VFARAISAVRGTIFLLAYGLFTVLIFDLGTRLAVWPAVHLFPNRRRRIIGGWFYFLGNATLAMARAIVGVRVVRRGRLPAESCVVVMNHQSLLDVPLAASSVRGTQIVIPTRDRYRRWIPGVSPIGRLSGFPYLSQRAQASRAEISSLTKAAEDCERGETTLVIYPEGHRTRDGQVEPFMKNGLRLILKRTTRPVYLLVSDNMWRSRTLSDMVVRFAGTTIPLVAVGPIARPEGQSLDEFIDQLHARLIDALAEIRQPPLDLPAGVA